MLRSVFDKIGKCKAEGVTDSRVDNPDPSVAVLYCGHTYTAIGTLFSQTAATSSLCYVRINFLTRKEFDVRGAMTSSIQPIDPEKYLEHTRHPDRENTVTNIS